MNDGQELAVMPLGEHMQQRYGSPYVTIHRADLHALLLQTAKDVGAGVHCDMEVLEVVAQPDGLQIQLNIAGNTHTQYASLAVIADGVWSALRRELLGDGLPQYTGHVAYRTLMKQSDLPQQLRSQDVTVWMGADSHVVHYPVRGGEWLNLVCLVEGQNHSFEESYRHSWDHPTAITQTQADLQKAMRGACSSLKSLLDACQHWRMWPLFGRPFISGAHEHVHGRIALIGDAAHPMLPYLAQGAGMAIEDARQLELDLQHASVHSVPSALQAFAQARWRRNARVQHKAASNGQIFHAKGAAQWGRDTGLRLLGAQLMDMPWLYAAQY
jgi:salicylate hydroxylase